MLEVNDVDMVEIIDVVDGQSKVKDDNGKAKSKVPMKIPRSKLVGKAASITLKLMAKPLAKVLTKVQPMMSKLGSKPLTKMLANTLLMKLKLLVKLLAEML